ncbi:MAG: dihydrofolate reductase [Ignavibacteriae bacterium]|nr:dihydrofolate reductase [Ignavibacteriota bacterium]
MRKVILNLAVSLDGYIEGPNGEFDWCFTDQDYGMSDFMKRIDAVFLGRKSYELTRKMKNPYPHLATYVFSNTLKQVEKDVWVVKGDIEKEVTRMKKQNGKDMWLFGGANLLTSFLNAGLVDEMQLAVHPLVLGGGKLLFQDIHGRIPLTLKDTKTYSTGLVQLFYEQNRQ